MSGPAPFGSAWRDGKLIPQPGEAHVVTALVEAYLASGGRMKPAAATLNAKGFRTRRGAPWTDVAVARVLEQDCLRTLVHESLWLRCEELLAARGSPSRRAAHPLGGAVRCRCGARMYIRGNGASGKFICQECKSKIPCEVVERKFLEGLHSVLLSSQELTAAIQDDPRTGEVTRALGGQEVSVAQAWPDLEASERRQLVDVLVDHIEIDVTQISVVLAVPDRFQAENEAPVPSSLPSSQKPREKATSEESSSTEGGILLSADEAAQLLRTTRRAVYVMADRGALPGVTRLGRRLLVRQDDLLRWLDESRAPSPTEERR